MFMEKITFTNSTNLKLVGNLHTADSKSVIIMAHGFCGDKSAGGRFDKISDTLNKSGFNVLTFDFSGCGESDDVSLTCEMMEDDLNSAISFVKSRGYQNIALYGHSLGALICLRSYTPEIVTMVFSGALTDSMIYDWDKYFSEEYVIKKHNNGDLTVKDNSEWRRQITIGHQIPKEIEQIDQKSLFEKIKCPVLIIHGNDKNDEEEKMLLKRSKRGLEYLSDDSKLEIIDGADHRFYDHIEKLSIVVRDWCLSHLNRS